MILATPYLYNLSTLFINTVGLSTLSYGNPGGLLFTDVIRLVRLGTLVGYSVPLVATLAADILFALVITIAFIILRFVLIGAIVGVAPILAVLWLFPPLRRVVNIFFEVAAGLGIAGIVDAAVLALTAKIAFLDPSGVSIEIAISSPILFAAPPTFLGLMFSSGVGNITKAACNIAGRFGPTLSENVRGSSGGGGGGGTQGRGAVLVATPPNMGGGATNTTTGTTVGQTQLTPATAKGSLVAAPGGGVDAGGCGSCSGPKKFK